MRRQVRALEMLDYMASRQDPIGGYSLNNKGESEAGSLKYDSRLSLGRLEFFLFE
jgi:hypothetical protein